MIVVDNSVFIDLIFEYYLLEEFDRVKEKIGRS